MANLEIEEISMSTLAGQRQSKSLFPELVKLFAGFLTGPVAISEPKPVERRVQVRSAN
jgi:hypothetical protein